MTEPVARLSEAEAALNNPSLALFRQPRAPVVLATLTPIFEQGQSGLAAGSAAGPAQPRSDSCTG